MTDTEHKIAVYVPDSEAKLFLLFKEHQDIITLLLEKDVFKQKNAAITLNFDHKGMVQTIERRDWLYNVRHESKSINTSI